MRVIGDVSYPNASIKWPDSFRHGTLLLNCEGYLCKRQDQGSSSTVYNHMEIFSKLKNPDLVLGLANNHIMDIENGIGQSVDMAHKMGLKYVGAGKDIYHAKKSLIVEYPNNEIAIIAAGWDVIGCTYASHQTPGVNPLKSAEIAFEIDRQKEAGRKVLVYLHWGYELEIYPHPSHREMALRFVDCGADIIIGCHAHCIQGHELYKGKNIFYGIGNGAFKQGFYLGGRVKFPDFCTRGIWVDWNPKSNDVRVGDIWLENEDVKISESCVPENHSKLTELSGFFNLSSKEYIDFFKKNRRKRKLLPVFHESDDSFLYRCKVFYLKLRTKIISSLFMLGIKGGSR